MWTQIIIGLVVISLAGMTIPILQILKSQPGKTDHEERIKRLEEKIMVLEQENANKALEIEDLKKEVSFTAKLLDK